MPLKVIGPSVKLFWKEYLPWRLALCIMFCHKQPSQTSMWSYLKAVKRGRPLTHVPGFEQGLSLRCAMLGQTQLISLLMQEFIADMSSIRLLVTCWNWKFADLRLVIITWTKWNHHCLLVFSPFGVELCILHICWEFHFMLLNYSLHARQERTLLYVNTLLPS